MIALSDCKATFLRIVRSREAAIFLACFSYYFAVALILVFKTNIIDYDPELIGCDIYFGFDNPAYIDFFGIYIRGFHDLRHPFFKMLSFPFILGLKVVEELAGRKAMVATLTAMTSGAVSGAVVLVYKYLKDVVKLESPFRLGILTALFAAFANNLIVSFTPESFPFSLLFLMLFVYYLSNKVISGEEVSPFKMSLLTVVCTGITVTNAAKCFLLVFFLKNRFYQKMRIFASMLAGLLAAFIVYVIFFKSYSLVFFLTSGDHIKSFNPGMWIHKQVGEIHQFTGAHLIEIVNGPFQAPFHKAVLSYFLGFPVLFSERFTNIPVLNMEHYDQINALPYQNPAYYVLVAGLFFLLLMSLWMNRANRVVWILAASFATDFVLHVVVGFGLYEGFMYGSHWVFVVPCFLGWLYASLQHGGRKTLDIALLGLLLFVVANNARGMGTFLSMAFRLYPVN